MTDSNDSTLNRTLYELGFLDKKGNPEKDKDKRWRVNVNEAELIIKDLMNKLEAKERIAKLSEVVLYHQKKYHEEDMPQISDEVYDALVRELRELEAKHPELKAKDSPSDRVGGEPK